MDKYSIEHIKTHYKTVVIGGGIVGAGIFRDLSLNNVPTLLIEKKDFSSQTSSKSSKMLHGGVRYLENMDFDLVWEALHEKNLWLKLAPHLCYDASFYLPIYKSSIRPMWMIKAGLFLYDFLSSFKNIPHKMVGKDQVLKALPQLNPQGLRGAGVYHDAIVDDVRLTIEVILDGLNNKSCHAINHTSLESFSFNDHKQIVTLQVYDEITQTRKEVSCDELVFATGPFTDEILQSHPQLNWQPKLLPSKGSHLWLKKEALNVESPMLLTPADGRVIFVIPQKGSILVGTTEQEHNGDKFDLQASEVEIDYLLANLNEFFPTAKISKEQIESSFAGLRPLVKEDSSAQLSKTARNHKYYQPRHNLHVMMGGKYTTFRVMAQEVAKNICSKHRIPYCASKTKSPLKLAYKYEPFATNEIPQEIQKQIMKNEIVRTPMDYQRRIGQA